MIDKDKDEIDFFEYVKIIKDNRWFIIFSMIFFIVVGVCYAKLSTPVYQANVIFKVDNDKSRISNLGQDIANLFSLSSSTVVETETIKSRKFLSKTIDDLDLQIVVTPQKKSFFKNILSKLSYDPKKVNVDKLVVNNKENDHFELIVTDAKLGCYTLINELTNTQLEGRVGELEKKCEL